MPTNAHNQNAYEKEGLEIIQISQYLVHEFGLVHEFVLSSGKKKYCSYLMRDICNLCFITFSILSFLIIFDLDWLYYNLPNVWSEF